MSAEESGDSVSQLRAEKSPATEGTTALSLYACAYARRGEGELVNSPGGAYQERRRC